LSGSQNRRRQLENHLFNKRQQNLMKGVRQGIRNNVRQDFRGEGGKDDKQDYRKGP